MPQRGQAVFAGRQTSFIERSHSEHRRHVSCVGDGGNRIYAVRELNLSNSVTGRHFRLSQLHFRGRTRVDGAGRWGAGCEAESESLGSNWPAAARVGSLRAREALVSWPLPRPCINSPSPSSLHPPPTPFSPYLSLLSLALLFFTHFLVLHFFFIAPSHLFLIPFSLSPSSPPSPLSCSSLSVSL